MRNNKNKVRLTESQLNRVIKESIKKVLRESSNRKEVFTIDAFDIIDEESITPMSYSVTFYDIDEAIDNARELASELVSYENCCIVSVFAGEYEDGNGNIFGEPEAIYDISNKDERTTSIARRRVGYVSDKVDEYIQ